MSEFQVDLRFPIKVYKENPFVYTGPDFRSLPMGLISDTLNHEGRQYQRFYPFTVTSSTFGGAVEDVLFCFMFVYINDDDERSIYLTKPIPLSSSSDATALDALINEARRLAKYIGSSTLEIEVNAEASRYDAFPTSPSFLSYSKEGKSTFNPNVYGGLGFKETACLISLEAKIEDVYPLVKDKDVDSNKYDVFTESPVEYKGIKKYARNFPLRSYELTNNDEALGLLSLPFFEESCHMVRKETGIIRKQRSPKAYFRWIPDIFESSLENRSPTPLLFYQELEKYRYHIGKICDWAFSERDRNLMYLLLFQAVRYMRDKGIERIQFSNIPRENKFVLDLLGTLGFESVSRTLILRGGIR
jgi:hypothetical protein